MSFEEVVGETIEDIMKDIALHREEILKAFVAKYGYQPDEVEQVVDLSRYADGVITWSVRKKENRR